MWEAGTPSTPYDTRAGKLNSFSKLKTQPAPSQAYDPNAVIWARNTMTARKTSSNRYDGSSGQITTGKKDVTNRPRKFSQMGLGL
jgi:hypothetical protein